MIIIDLLNEESWKSAIYQYPVSYFETFYISLGDKNSAIWLCYTKLRTISILT